MAHPVIGIIGGHGKMGVLFASFFAERNVKVLISDIGTKLKNKDIAGKSDIVIVSVPIDKTVSVIREILPYVKAGSAITDFTSVKENPVKEMMKSGNGVEVFGMHPMFGNSNPIPGQTVIMSPTKRSGKWYKWMKNFLLENGAMVKEMNASDHDKTMAIAQDLIHFVEITCSDGLRLTGLKIEQILPCVSKASELKVMSSARILDQDAGLYGNMQIENPYNLKFLNRYKKSVDDLVKIIQKKDLGNFKKYFETTRKYLGKYADQAYKESSFLIDKLIENRRRQKSAAHQKVAAPKRGDIALLGPKYTFSDFAADKYLICHSELVSGSKIPNQVRNDNGKFYARDLEEVFELVEKGKVAKGIVPIENKLDGTIRETLDLLFHKNVHINGIINLPIHHYLVVLPHANAKNITTIISHQQPLNQCKKYLAKHFPNTAREAYSSTVKALEKMIFSNNQALAVISSKEAAQAYDVKILAENIEDDPSNSTSFYVIEKGEYKPQNSEQKNSTKSQKTAIAFYFDKDSPGSLFKVFEDFANAKINLTKIESRPTRKEFGDYIFYLDFEGSLFADNVKETLNKVSKKVARLKILGTY